jgi:hypothetical protein
VATGALYWYFPEEFKGILESSYMAEISNTGPVLGPLWDTHAVQPVAPVTDIARSGEYPRQPGQQGQPEKKPHRPAVINAETGKIEETVLYDKDGNIVPVTDGPGLIGIA